MGRMTLLIPCRVAAPCGAGDAALRHAGSAPLRLRHFDKTYCGGRARDFIGSLAERQDVLKRANKSGTLKAVS
jgi:hypothetical protein